MLEIIEQYWLLILVGQYPNGPLGGLAMTVIIALSTLAMALPLSVLFALARTSGIAWLSRPVLVVVTIVRGLPFLMFVFWVYFGAPVLFGITLGGTSTMIVALVVYESAYLSEIVRAGINAIPKGQIEACQSLGIKWAVRTFKIILPQALFNMLPSIVTQLSSIVKETSVGYVISAQEVTFAATQVNNIELTKPMEVFGMLAIIFYLLCGSLTLIAKKIETRIIRQRSRSSHSTELQITPEAEALLSR